MRLNSPNKLRVCTLSFIIFPLLLIDLAVAQSSVICPARCTASGSACLDSDLTTGTISSSCHRSNLNVRNGQALTIGGSSTKVVITGDLQIDGAPLTISHGATVCVGGNVIVRNGGTLSLQGGSKLCVQNKFTNQHTVMIEGGSILEVKGMFDNSNDKSLELKTGGKLVVHGNFDNVPGGKIDVKGPSLVQIRGTLQIDARSSIQVRNRGGFSAATVTGSGGKKVPPGIKSCGSGGSCTAGKLGGSAKTLPVSLLFFRAENTERIIQLTWKTASESNNDHFNLYRSYEGAAFEKIHQVKGQGTTQTPHHYQATDRPLAVGTYYYQLEQVDGDGKSERFRVVKVKWYDDDASPDHELQLHPMPIRSGQRLYADLSLPEGTPVTVHLFNILGHKVAHMESSKSSDGRRLEIRLPEVSAGVYVLQVNTHAEQYLKKIQIN